MRPIERGIAPNIQFQNYREAFNPLTSRLGHYCSYCERRLETHLAIEHVQPKSLNIALSLIWGNFLLACTNCNSCKGDNPINLADYLWPDINNTLRAFKYQNGLVEIALPITHVKYNAALSLLTLVGLDKYPGNPNPQRISTDADLRWKSRLDVQQYALRCKSRLETNPSNELRDTIIDAALGWGFFSIWFSIFQDDLEMRSRLVRQFLGTRSAAFDANFMPFSDEDI